MIYQLNKRLISTGSSLLSNVVAPNKFRDVFQLPSQFDYRKWFPLHMSVQLRKMEAKIRSVDLVVEVHDARIPVTGRNEQFLHTLYAVRPHILVFNKCDLIDMKKYKTMIEDYYYSRGVRKVLFTDCKRRLPRALNELKTSMLTALESEPRYNREVKNEYQAMVVGIPNVGKSSLINALRTFGIGIKKKAVEAGARPGVTVRVQNRVRIIEKPPVYIIDTPGVLSPHHGNIDEAMKLALCDLILESHVNIYYLADYLLFWLNKVEDFSYTKLYESVDKEPSDNIQLVLAKICSVNNFRISTRAGDRWDLDKGAKFFVQCYRNSKFADNCLDSDILF